MPKHIRISSDGTSTGTRVFVGELEITESLVGVSWSVLAPGRAEVSLTFISEDAELQAFGDALSNGPVRSIRA